MLLYNLVDLLPYALQPKAKALLAAVSATLLPLVLPGLLTGEWDKAAIIGAVAGLLVGGTTYATPNLPPVDAGEVTVAPGEPE